MKLSADSTSASAQCFDVCLRDSSARILANHRDPEKHRRDSRLPAHRIRTVAGSTERTSTYSE